MNEDHIQQEQNNSSMWTQTQRRQNISSSAEKPNIKQKNTKIFKYPYLVERSSQKLKQDNESDKSTEKHRPRNPHRKKIFDTKSSMISQMKQSTLSADRNRIIHTNRNFELNPIQNKLRNSKNKSTGMKRSEQSSFNHPINMAPNHNINKCSPVVFNYMTPSQIGHPSISVTRTPHTILLPTTSYQQAANIPNYLNSLPGQKYVEQPIAYISNPVYSRNQTVALSQIPIRAQIPSARKQENWNRITPPVSSTENPYRSAFLSTSVQSPTRVRHQISQSINLSPIPLTNPQVQNSAAQVGPKLMSFRPTNLMPQQMKNSKDYLNVPIPKVEEKKKSMFREYPSVPSQQTVVPNMYETYKIGQKFIKQPSTENKNLLSVSTKRNSPRRHKVNHERQRSPTKQNQKRPSLQQFHDVKHCQSQSSEVENEVSSMYEQARYSDRFFDMDFPNSHNQEKPSKASPGKLSVDSNKIQITKLHRKQSQQFDNKLKKKNSITSIVFQKQKSKQAQQSNKKINRLISFQKQSIQFGNQNKTKGRKNIFTAIDTDGRLIPFILVSLGIVLILIQLIK